MMVSSTAKENWGLELLHYALYRRHKLFTSIAHAWIEIVHVKHMLRGKKNKENADSEKIRRLETLAPCQRLACSTKFVRFSIAKVANAVSVVRNL